MDELFAVGEAPPAVLVWVDAWTSLGGSQFLDSPGTGRYHTYLCDEVVPWVDSALPHACGARPPRDRRQVERRLRRDGDADAPARPLRRLRHTRRRRALRDLLPAGVPRLSARAARRVRRLVRPVLGGLPLPARVLEEGRPRAPERLVHGRLLLGRRGRHDPPPVRTADRASSCPRSGSAGSPGTRCGWRRVTPTRCGRRRRFTSTPASGTTSILDLGAEAFRRALEEIGINDYFFELFDGTHIGNRVPLSARRRSIWPRNWRRDRRSPPPLVCLDPGTARRRRSAGRRSRSGRARRV